MSDGNVTSIGDKKSVLDEARDELAKENGLVAKKSVKSKLKEIAAAEKVLRNLNQELAVLLEDIDEDL